MWRRFAWLFLVAMAIVPSARADEPAPYQDPAPRRYEWSARASDIDPRVRSHPEIDFLLEKQGRPQDLQQAMVDTRVTPRGRLVIWLMSYPRELFEQLSSEGFHVLRVHYANGWFGRFGARSVADGEVLGNIRLEAATGQDVSELVDIPLPDSIAERTRMFLKWLSQEHPQGGWEQYLTPGGEEVRWDRVILAGASHGATTAARFAKHQRVDRVVMLCGPRDQLESWQSLPSATPAHCYFGFSHVLDSGWTGHHYCRSWEMLGLNEFGPVVDVDDTAPPFEHSRRLITHVDVGGDANRAHGSVVPGRNAIRDAEGNFVHRDVLKYLFTEPVEEQGAPVPRDPSCQVAR